MADRFATPTLQESVKNIMQSVENKVYDQAAIKAGYDPTSAYIIGALTTDNNDLESALSAIDNAANAPQNAPGMVKSIRGADLSSPNTPSQIAVGVQRQKLIHDLITHYGKRYGKPQKTGENDAQARAMKTT